MSVPENTVDYAGFALSTAGAPLVDRAVTLKRVDTLATVGSTVTDANGKWFFNDIAATPEVKAEISAGTTPQIAVKRCWSGDVWSIYVREKLGSAPAAIFNLPAIGNIYANGTLLSTAVQAALDGVYVNASGDTISGNLTVDGSVTSNDPLMLGASSAPAPALAFTFDPDTGIAWEAANQYSLVAGGAQIVTITPAAAEFWQTVMAQDGIDCVGSIHTNVAGGDAGVDGSGNLYTNVGGLQIAGTATIDGTLNANARILVDGGTLALPEIASSVDPNTGIVWSGSDILQFAANGQEIARVWMNGAQTQFASYANQTYIGSQLLLGGTQVATSVSGLVRVLQVRDGAGNPLGWMPIYGAIN